MGYIEALNRIMAVEGEDDLMVTGENKHLGVVNEREEWQKRMRGGLAGEFWQKRADGGLMRRISMAKKIIAVAGSNELWKVGSD